MRRVLYWLGFVWALPVTLIGLLNVLFSKFERWRWKDGCLEFLDADIAFKTGPGVLLARTLGVVILYSKRRTTVEEFGKTATHEKRHVFQCLCLGPLMLLAYPIAMLIAVVRGQHYYYDCWFEVDARKHASQSDPR